VIFIKEKIPIQTFVNWTKKVNPKKFWSIFIAIFFIFYVYKYDSSAPLYERLLISAFGATITPPIIFAFLWVPVFGVLMIWVALEGFFKWFLAWITK
jgi:hypothetical protein